MTDDLGQRVAHVRPHYRREGALLYFMISKRPALELAPDEVGLFEAIDGRRTIDELVVLFPLAAEKLNLWHRREVIELIRPCPKPNGRHIVVIEPHMDDAALSVAGRLLRRRGHDRVTILSVVRRSNYTSYFHLEREYFDVDAITQLRMKESAMAAALLGAEHVSLDWEDAPIRFRAPALWSLESLRRLRNAAEAYACTSPLPADVSALTRLLIRECERLQPDELWFPLGLGSHIDHRATRSASVKMAQELRRTLPHLQLMAYEDLPYSAVEQGAYSSTEHAHAIVQAFERLGTRLIRRTESIADTFEEKTRAISVFASQFKKSVMEPKIRHCADSAGGDGLCEAYYEIEGSLQLPRESEMAPDAAALLQVRSGILTLLQEGESVDRVAVVVLPFSHLGKWDADSHILRTAFPHASVRLYVTSEGKWEADGARGERMHVHEVSGGLGGILSVAWHEWYHCGTPTVLVWWGASGGGSGWKQRLLQTVLPFRRTIFARTLGDFCALIAEERGASVHVVMANTPRYRLEED